jgi:hypothetical protein
LQPGTKNAILQVLLQLPWRPPQLDRHLDHLNFGSGLEEIDLKVFSQKHKNRRLEVHD